mgnify:CR=1 FL=1
MQHIFADRTISISEFKQNPGKAIDAAEGKPLAVLKNNKPGFYAVPAELFEQIADIIDDLLLADTVRERMERGSFVKVDREDL